MDEYIHKSDLKYYYDKILHMKTVWWDSDEERIYWEYEYDNSIGYGSNGDPKSEKYLLILHNLIADG